MVSFHYLNLHGECMYIAIEGVIGVGKTTLARLLQSAFNAEILLEVFEENPFLSDFYGDRERYAFQTQMFFLLSRYHQQNRSIPELLKKNDYLLSDYTFAKDGLFARINLSGDELDMYGRVHEALAEKIKHPDLLVYLQATTETLMDRIAMRDRPYERDMESAYIAELGKAYDDFFSKPYNNTPVLTIKADQLDFVRNPEDLKFIKRKIEEALKATPLQPELIEN
ncbi:MAG: deoxynucleoside kinase [Chloroflexi bacterium]|nr:deoxynucleoside kinase [Chloroflexota bacterium]